MFLFVYNRIHTNIQTFTSPKQPQIIGEEIKLLLYYFSVDILLKATGNAPIMKKKKWAVDAEKPIGWIVEFVKKYLKLEPEEKLVSLLRWRARHTGVP